MTVDAFSKRLVHVIITHLKKVMSAETELFHAFCTTALKTLETQALLPSVGWDAWAKFRSFCPAQIWGWGPADNASMHF